MLSYRQARQLVLRELRSLEVLLGDCVILDYQTIERDWGWMIFYDSLSYLETGELQSRLFGNAPYIVNRYSGEIRATGTEFTPDSYIASYEAALQHEQDPRNSRPW